MPPQRLKSRPSPRVSRLQKNSQNLKFLQKINRYADHADLPEIMIVNSQFWISETSNLDKKGYLQLILCGSSRNDTQSWRPKPKSIPSSRTRTRKIIPCLKAHPRILDMRECPTWIFRGISDILNVPSVSFKMSYHQ